ncbi:MAG: hypothetical protein WCL07_00755 [bacterium]
MDDQTKSPSLSDYADTLIKEKNYTTLTEEARVELRNDLLRRLNEFMMAKVVAELNEKDTQEFSTMLDTNPSEEQIQTFIKGKLSNPTEFIGNTLISFRKTFLGLE